MHIVEPTYYRARLDTFRHFIHNELPDHPRFDNGLKNSPLELLKQGFVHPDIQHRFDSRVESFQRMGIDLPNTPLTFTELCTFNTWFAMHPEKVAGTEKITSSREFPLTIKGTRDDVIRVFSGDDKNKRLRIAKAQAASRLKLLTLAELAGFQKKVKISVRDAKRWVREGDMFFVVKSWFRDGQITNRVHEPHHDAYTKYIEVGNGTLILDLNNYQLIWQE